MQGGAQRLPPHCIPREKHIGTNLKGYIASKNEKIKKEAHRHKSRWIIWKKKKEKMNPKKRCLWTKGKTVGSKGSRWKNKSGWGGSPAMRTKKEHEKNRKAQVYMDNHKDKMKPKKRWYLLKKGNRVGSKGNRLKNKSGWGGAGGRAQRLPPQCVPRI